MPIGSYMYGMTTCFASKSQQQSNSMKCVQAVNRSGEVFNVTLSLVDDGRQLVSMYDARYCAPQYRSIWLAPQGHLVGRYYVEVFLADKSNSAGLQMRAYIDPDYNHPTGQYCSCSLDDKTAGYTYQGLWRLDADNVAKICAWLIDGICKSCYEIEQKER